MFINCSSKLFHLSYSNAKKNNLKIVVIGGGTGLSVMLRGLKKYTHNITAIVTVADDGGGSGILRQDLGMLPPGDIRNCILALAETEPVIGELLHYRFSEGSLKGQSFGNLFLAAMNGISSNFEEAVRKMSDVLKVTGKVLPVTLDNVDLAATLENDVTIIGESKISEQAQKYNSKIKYTRLVPPDVKPLPDAINAIKEADLIVLGPGSLYTSIIPNLLVDGIAKAIFASDATTVYICNIMTQAYETVGYTAFDHYKAIIDHSFKHLIDYCVINSETLPMSLIHKYKAEGSELVKMDRERFKDEPAIILERDLVKIQDDFVRHDTDVLAKLLIKLGAVHKKKQNQIHFWGKPNNKLIFTNDSN